LLLRILIVARSSTDSEISCEAETAADRLNSVLRRSSLLPDSFEGRIFDERPITESLGHCPDLVNRPVAAKPSDSVKRLLGVPVGV
jgi:hypothetical protein